MKDNKNNNQNSYINAYLKTAFEKLNKKQSEIIKDLGVSQAYVSALMNGKKRVGKEMAKKISQLYGFDEGSILTGEGEILKEEKKYVEEVSPIPYDNYMEVEYADLSTVAGRLGGYNPATLPEMKRRLIPKEFDRGNYLVVRVDGDSMDDGTSISIPDGTEILIKEYYLEKGEKLPIRGNLFVIVSTEGTVFKQIIEHNTEEGYIICHSYNQKYSDYRINLSEVLQIFIYRKIVSFRPSIPEINR
nr:MAG TPA: helix-turn-helix domain protein [Caudoviricetes sp.]